MQVLLRVKYVQCLLLEVQDDMQLVMLMPQLVCQHAYLKKERCDVGFMHMLHLRHVHHVFIAA